MHLKFTAYNRDSTKFRPVTFQLLWSHTCQSQA